MKKLLTFSLVLICLQTMAQKPIIVKPTQIPPGQMIKQGDAMKKVAENQAATDKVLNAKLNKVTFSIWGNNNTPAALGGFKYKGVDLDGNIENKFHFSLRNMSGPLEGNTITWSSPVTGKYESTDIDYKTFLENGFTVKINFSDKYPNAKGKEFTANYSVGFTFTDGTQVTIPLQEITLGKKGYWTTTGDVNISKSFAGNVFPDPANPLLLPVVK